MAVSILAIVVLGTAYFSFYSTGQIGLGKYHRMALQLATQKLEQLRADNDMAIEVPDGETSEDLELGDATCTRTTVVVDCGSYKQITVTVSWTQMEKPRQISLDTFYVKK